MALGAFLGLAQMTLSSTLVIDTCESFQRTEANYFISWFSRLALALGPFVALATYRVFDYGSVLLVACGLSAVAFVLVAMVKFPFKAPSENMPLLSLDRFFLPQGMALFVNLAMLTTVVGIFFTMYTTELFYCMMMVGFSLALLSEKYAFANADLKSEVITGIILLTVAILVLYSGQSIAVDFVCPACVGFGIGIIGSRFLLFYIKLAKHCQRGTSQSSFFLAWELGLSLGLFIGISKLSDNLLHLCLVLLVIGMVFYNFFVHPWYVKHKNR